jgi:hypothetical protein
MTITLTPTDSAVEALTIWFDELELDEIRSNRALRFRQDAE